MTLVAFVDFPGTRAIVTTSAPRGRSGSFPRRTPGLFSRGNMRTIDDAIVNRAHRSQLLPTPLVGAAPTPVLFHNSAITPPVSWRIRRSHQVLPISTQNGSLAVIEHPRRTAPTLNAHARAQRATGDSLTSRHCPTPRSEHSERSAGQPFQGGGTGSNPVGGASFFLVNGYFCLVRFSVKSAKLGQKQCR